MKKNSSKRVHKDYVIDIADSIDLLLNKIISEMKKF